MKYYARWEEIVRCPHIEHVAHIQEFISREEAEKFLAGKNKALNKRVVEA